MSDPSEPAGHNGHDQSDPTEIEIDIDDLDPDALKALVGGGLFEGGLAATGDDGHADHEAHDHGGHADHEAHDHDAHSSLAICEESGIGDWVLAAAYEALARASGVAGDREGFGIWLERARSATAAIANPQDRGVIEQDLAALGR